MKRLTSVIGLILLSSGAPAGPVVAPGDNLVVRNIPRIPIGLAARVERYQNMRSARFLGWLPEDGGVLIATRFAETDQLHLVRSAGGRREQLTFFDERISWARHSPAKKSSFVLFGMDTGGNEAFQIYRLDRKSGQAVMLTDGHSRNMQAVWNRTGDQVAFTSTRRNGKDFDEYEG